MPDRPFFQRVLTGGRPPCFFPCSQAASRRFRAWCRIKVTEKGTTESFPRRQLFSPTPPFRVDESREPVRGEAEGSFADFHDGGAKRRLRETVDLGFRDP